MSHMPKNSYTKKNLPESMVAYFVFLVIFSIYTA